MRVCCSNLCWEYVSIDGSLPAGKLMAVGEVRHGDRVMRFVTADFESDGTIALMTDGGMDNASGEWTVTIDELFGSDRLQGPWVLMFNGP